MQVCFRAVATDLRFGVQAVRCIYLEVQLPSFAAKFRPLGITRSGDNAVQYLVQTTPDIADALQEHPAWKAARKADQLLTMLPAGQSAFKKNRKGGLIARVQHYRIAAVEAIVLHACLEKQCQPPWMRLLAADGSVVPWDWSLLHASDASYTFEEAIKLWARSIGPAAWSVVCTRLFDRRAGDAASWFPGAALAGPAGITVSYLLDNRYKEDALSTAACLAGPEAEAQVPGSSQAEPPLAAMPQTPLAAQASVVGEHLRLVHDSQGPIAAATQLPSADENHEPLSTSAHRVCMIDAIVDPASAGSVGMQPDAPGEGSSAPSADDHQPSAADCGPSSLQECLPTATVSGAQVQAVVSKASPPALVIWRSLGVPAWVRERQSRFTLSMTGTWQTDLHACVTQEMTHGSSSLSPQILWVAAPNIPLTILSEEPAGVRTAKFKSIHDLDTLSSQGKAHQAVRVRGAHWSFSAHLPHHHAAVVHHQSLQAYKLLVVNNLSGMLVYMCRQSTPSIAWWTFQAVRCVLWASEPWSTSHAG